MNEAIKGMSLAGTTAVIVVNFTHPIETVKTNMQVQGRFSLSSFVKTEGVRGFYKGIVPAIMREASYTSFKLGAYGPIKKLYGADAPGSPFLLKFAAGSTSGVVGSFLGNPFDIVKTLQQAMSMKDFKSTRLIFKEIYAERGLAGFMRGVQANAIRACVLNGTKMSCYDQIKGYTVDYTGWARSEVRTQFASAVMAGFCMAVTVSPFDRLRTLLMNQGKNAAYNGFMDCFLKTVRSEGLFSLYRGFFPIWARFAPQATGQLLVFEFLCRISGMQTI